MSEIYEPDPLAAYEREEARYVRFLKRAGIALGVTAILAGVLTVGGFFLNVWWRLPDTNGTFHHESLGAEVRVKRDEWGVPHIRAESGPDAYFAYGFTVAQDRLFQLEIHRRLARGELSEIFGEVTLSTDRVSRMLLWRKTAENLLRDPGAFDPEFLGILDAFLAGINFFIESEPLPPEFLFLGIDPKPFTRVDSVAFYGYMAYGFAEGIRSDSLFSVLKADNPELDVEALFPGYSRQSPVTIVEGVHERTTRLERAPEQSDTAAQSGGLGELRLLLAELDGFFGGVGALRGSNSWVLGPSRTDSGHAILANDPHIGFSNPGVWYEAHIRYGDFENYGVHLPLIPFPLLGFSSDKAWAITMFENDDVDLYRETYHPNDPDQVMYRGEWVALEQWTESIEVKGEVAPVRLRIKVTPHGPIITDMLEGYSGPPVAVWWMFHKMSPAGVEALYHLGVARSLEETAEAVSKIEAPGLNISYADREGNIAWWAAAKLPIRPPHVNSMEILDGTSGDDEIRGFVPFEENPQMVNPASGAIVTANNMSTTGPVGPIPELEGYWQPSDRAARIGYLLSQQTRWNLDALRGVQFDDFLQGAPALTAVILEAIESVDGGVGGETGRQAIEALRVWDYRHDLNSIGAGVFHVVREALLERVVGDELGRAHFETYTSLANSTNFLAYVAVEPSSPFWDDVGTAGLETRQDTIVAAFEGALHTLEEEYGENPGSWRWGQIHTVEYRHLMGRGRLLAPLYNIGPYPARGSNETVAKMSSGTEYRVDHGASMRLLIDFADLGAGWMILPTGNSGHFMSKHYDDQAEMYLGGEYRGIVFSNEQVEAATGPTMRFLPTR